MIGFPLSLYVMVLCRLPIKPKLLAKPSNIYQTQKVGYVLVKKPTQWLNSMNLSKNISSKLLQIFLVNQTIIIEKSLLVVDYTLPIKQLEVVCVPLILQYIFIHHTNNIISFRKKSQLYKVPSDFHLAFLAQLFL